MSGVVTRPESPATASVTRPSAASERPPIARKRRRFAGYRGPAALFLVAYAFYAGVGLYVTLSLHAVAGDAEARLSHAYFALWDDPGKLAAIGFYWPPLQTAVFLPVAVIRPLATSLAALPLVSALFAAGIVVVMERALALSQLRAWLRWSIVIAVGLNPALLFYAANGMAESLYAFFLALGLLVFVRWTIAPRWYHVPLAGFILALGVLARFEVGLWTPVVAFGIAGVMIRRRSSLSSIEGSLVAFGTPIAYALLIWVYLNWEIVGNPFAFLEGGAVNLEAASAPEPAVGDGDPTVARGPLAVALTLALDVFRLEHGLFWPTSALAAVLLIVAVSKKRFVALVLSGALLTNALATIVLILALGGQVLLFFRYHVRIIPITVVAFGWLLTVLPPSRLRLPGMIALASAVLAIPATGATMFTYPPTVGERGFLEALLEGADQDGILPPRGSGVPVGDEREMAKFIKANVPGRNAVLTDDAVTYGVMLADGHPSRYIDRIDVGDRRWEFIRDHPIGRTRYFLIPRFTGRALNADGLLRSYPTLNLRGTLKPNFLRLVHQNDSYALFAVARRARVGR